MKTIDKERILLLASENLNKFPCSENILGKNGFIYLSGSIMEGFGNETSDVDVYIIYEGEKKDIESFLRQQGDSTVIEKNDVYIWNFRIGLKRFDCEFWKYSLLNEKIEILNGVDVNSESHVGNIKLDANDLDFFHRYQYGMALFRADNYERELRKINFDKLKYILAVQNTAYASALLEDIQGAYLAEDRYSAYFLSKQLINYSVNAYLAIKGETNPSVKWTYRKIKRYAEKSGDKGLLSQYLELLTKGMDERTFDEVLSKSLEFSQSLLARNQKEILYFQKRVIVMSKTK